MSISVIISNMNGDKYLPRLIETLKAQRGVEMEIIVVDRDSRDQSLEILKKFPEIKVVNEPAETGLVAGYHRGTKVAKYELYFFANEDMWFDPDCLAQLQKHIDPSRKIVASDPWQWTYDGQKWIHGGVVFRKSRWNRGSSYPFCVFDFTADLKAGTKIPFACAGAFLMTREAYELVGGWDTSFFLDQEDVDLFLRIWQRGLYCVTVPEAKVYHAVGGSGGKVTTLKKQPVSKKRYVGGVVNKLAIPIKYGSFYGNILSGMNWANLFLVNLVKCRFQQAFYDFQALFGLVKRLPANLAYRGQNREWNKRAPGEAFFLDPLFGPQE